ncbi:MAG: response regulator [Planctomycetes bacterium]|nr:response regulator [Planctomycetota bacterium]
MNASTRRRLAELGFATAIIASSLLHEGGGTAVNQAILWLPSGVGIAGLWLLGLRSFWVVALATLTQRVLLDYAASVIWPAMIGSTAEAVVGAVILQRLGLRPDFARLRDTFTLFAAATIAPVGSILFSWIGKQTPGAWGSLGFYSGWDGWWRMNALGILSIVPPALTWLAPPRQPLRWRTTCEGMALLTITIVLLWGTMTTIRSAPSSIMALYLALPVSLIAALRFSQRAATAFASICAAFVATVSANGHGPFLSIPIEDRHVAIQIFELTMLSVPLVIGSLIAERERGRSLLLDSEGLRTALLSALPDTSYRMSKEGRFLDMFGPQGTNPPMSREQIIGKSIQDVASPELAARIQQAIDQAHEGEATAPIEYPVETSDGTRYREARYVRLPDGNVLALVRDISSRKHTQRLLAWQAGILELIATGRPNSETLAALVRGLELFLDRSKAAVMLLEGCRLHICCAPSLPEDYCQSIDGLTIGSGQGCCGTAAFENRNVIAADITTDPLWEQFRAPAMSHGLRSCWSVPVRSPSGAVFGTFAIYHCEVRDPSPADLAFAERVAVLAGISVDRERRESLLASIQSNVNEGIYRSVPGQGLVYVNEAFARQFGYGSPEELQRAVAAGDWEDAQHGRDLTMFRQPCGDSGSLELQLHRRDGTTFWGLLSHTAVLSPDGSPRACDGALADITRQKHLEEQLRQAQKMEAVGKLAGGVAHDFNNLLTAIGGYAEATIESLPAHGEPREFLDEILRATERAASLTKQLLAFSRRQVLTPQVLNLAAVIDKLASMLRRLIGERITFSTNYASGERCVRVDRGQLEQVLLNLVVNARDAMPDGGTLTIATERRLIDAEAARAHVDLTPGAYLAIAVRDTGVGMTAEVQSRAFDPFFTTKEVGRGTGLGLATVYGIVKQSGGAVWIESAPNAGTTVWILLPEAKATAAPEPVVTLPRPSAQPATILLAEDEEIVRNLVQRILTRAGYQVLVAPDGPQALSQLQRHAGHLHLLLTDAVMPQMTGRELANRVLAERPGTPVLFMSGYASDGQSLVSAVPGEVDFVQKPFVATNLLSRIAALIERGQTDAARSGAPNLS